MQVYFDNAATTPLHPEVIAAMLHTMQHHFGNPSSIHQFGRQTRVLIEKARRYVAESLQVSPAEVFFNSGATEGNNTVLAMAIGSLGVRQLICSPIEHPSVLAAFRRAAQEHGLPLSLVATDGLGHIDLDQLEELLRTAPAPALVSLMHANNEIGNLLPINAVSKLCRQYGAYFHSDMVQTVGRYQIDLQAIDLDFATASAHKFHGPKGVGFLYVNTARVSAQPWLLGGSQERNMRPGTENLVGIVGLHRALELAHEHLSPNMEHVRALKAYFVQLLLERIPDIEFLGDSRDRGLYSVLNVAFPPNRAGEMLIQNLDIAGIAASMGSACSSGTTQRSYVVQHLGLAASRYPVRFSFSPFNTKAEVEYCVDTLSKFF